ncbi:MAG: FAD-binding oxidoreductase [Saprospiraceae bacterium]|nr:FAD-binding oxidoreductase [Saprospiraceae bacterium]
MNLKQELEQLLPPDRVKTRLVERYAFASDASHYYLVPKAVVQPVNIEEVQRMFHFSHQKQLPLTFRAGGTSLSGQAVTDGILVDLSRYWRNIKVENTGETVRIEPAVIGAHVNIALKKYGRKMGPDPASIGAAMMGGILSNNASGMCCGVHHNSYHTLKSITFVLPNGLVFNTEKQKDYGRFENEASDIAQGIKKIREDILEKSALVSRIRQKYRQKNTTGYGLNAFLDFNHPLDILAHLLIGGEGTLGFIAEAVLKTIPDLPHKLTGMLYFDTPEAACDAIPALISTGAEALEFMDRASLRSVEDMKGVPDFVKTLPLHAAAILCEFQSDTEGGLLEKWQMSQKIIQDLPLIVEPNFTQNADEQAIMWKIRKGMYPSVASVRASGTAAMLEDLAFPVEKLGAAIVDVQGLFGKYGYENGIIFGHAKDGNLHFCISQSFATDAEIARFKAFSHDLFELVLKKYDGALKAEHGTGRAVAPYVEAEWGTEGYQIMKRLKQLVDPHNLLNTNVIISEDKNIDLQNLKIMPVVESEVDKCIECGFCESRCPSRDFTLTPRQRIGIRRAVQRLKSEGKTSVVNEINKDYQFYGMNTCAVDGMCATDCPVDINTGELIKRLRRENHSESANKMALRVAKNFKVLENTARFAVGSGLLMNRFLGKNTMKTITETVRYVVPSFPLWSNFMSKPPVLQTQIEPKQEKASITFIYFPSCINRMMGGDILTTFQNVCLKAHINLIVPTDIKGSCCGQIFSSKGFADAYKFTVNQTFTKIWQDTEGGKFGVVMDVTSCTQSLRSSYPYLSDENKQRFEQLAIYDSIDFAADVLIPRLNIVKKKDKIVFHPVCSVHKMTDFMVKLQSIGRACSHEAVFPSFANCCGMAGDRGFYYPNLTEKATAREAAEVKMQEFDGYYSSGKTCEMALSEAVGKSYESILKLLEEASI